MAKPKNSFITKAFGSVAGSSGAMVYVANPKTVEWAEGKVLHPEQIEKIYCYGKPCKPVKRKKVTLANGETAYTLWFVTPYAKTVRYSAVVDVEGNPTDRAHFG